MKNKVVYAVTSVFFLAVSMAVMPKILKKATNTVYKIQNHQRYKKLSGEK